MPAGALGGAQWARPVAQTALPAGRCRAAPAHSWPRFPRFDGPVACWGVSAACWGWRTAHREWLAARFASPAARWDPSAAVWHPRAGFTPLAHDQHRLAHGPHARKPAPHRGKVRGASLGARLMPGLRAHLPGAWPTRHDWHFAQTGRRAAPGGRRTAQGGVRLAQKLCRTPNIVPVCARPAAGVPPAAPLLTDTARLPLLSRRASEA